MKSNARQLAYCALFTALTAVLSQIQIPLPGGVPISLGLLGVLLAGVSLPPQMAAMSILAYILLGAVGVPVFSGLQGGLGILTGKTGGYIVGYLPCAVITALWYKRFPRFWPLCGGMALGVAACYALGTAWFMSLTGMTMLTSLGLCVFPFLPGDGVKIVLSALLANRVRKALRF